MTKNLFKGFTILLLGFMFSCDNTTADPINNTPNGSNNPGSTPSITGPRILHKVVANNVTNQEFVTTGNVLEKAIFKEASGPTSFIIGRVTYTSGKIQKLNLSRKLMVLFLQTV